MLSRTLAIAHSTFRETVRDRMFYLIGLFGLGLVGAGVVLSPLTVGAQGKIVADVGLGSMALLGLLVVLMVGSNLVRKEMDRRTITTVLTKPVSRGEYLLGRYLGLAVTLICMVVAMGLIHTVAVALGPGTFTAAHLAAIYLTYIELLVLVAAAVLFSFLVSHTLAGVLTVAMYVIGHLLRSLHDLSTMTSGATQKLVGIAYRVLPDLEAFNVRAEAVHGDVVTIGQLALATVYGLGWIMALLLLAHVLFARKEF